MFLEAGIEQIGGRFVVAVRSTFGFRNDVVDAAEFAEVGGSDAHGFGGEFFFGGVAPHDGGAAFRRNDGINRVLHHQYAVGDGDRQSSAAAADANDGRNDGNFQPRHLAEIVGDGFGLSAFFGMDARVSAIGIDQGEDRAAE